MKKVLIWGILVLILLCGFTFYKYENKDFVVEIPEQSHFSDSKNGLYYREVSFWIEEQNKDSQHLVKVDFPGIDFEEQYLILPVNDKHPAVWEKQQKLQKNLKLTEKKRYSVVTISRDKNILTSEEVVLNFNDATYTIESNEY